MKRYVMTWVDMLADGVAGPTRLRVRGRSMWPTLHPGDGVVVEAVAVADLVPGDWVIVRGAHGGFIHRYIGVQRGQLVTKGDAHLGFDPLWMPEALLGRVTEATRAGVCFYRRSAGQVRRERRRTMWHRMLGGGWAMLRRVKAWFLVVLATLLWATGVWAAVTVVTFSAHGEAQAITLHWETASETGNLGFYMWRSTTGLETGYAKLSQFILSQDEGMGATYDYVDTDGVQPGVVYYYKVQDVPDNGALGAFFGPVTVTLRVDPGPTVTPTATLAPTVTPTPTPSPTATPHPYVRFWADVASVDAGQCTIVQWLATQVKAVYLDGQGVVGEGAQTFCPCITQTHVLDVAYSDGGGEQFVITLTVRGTCANPLATATLMPLPTPLPTATSEGSTPTPRPTVTLPATAMPARELPAAMASPTRMVVEGQVSAPRVSARAFYLALLLVGTVLGLGFIGSGVWLWRRQQ